MRELNSMMIDDLSKLMDEYQQPRYRAKQLFKWLNSGCKPSEMTNLPKGLRSELEKYPYGTASIYEKWVSNRDSTVKYLFELGDGNMVEGVLMHYNHGDTLCLSTQVGCRMNCSFCASALDGMIRNITSGEMLSMLNCVEHDEPKDLNRSRRVTNMVFMGSGEPLDNYDNVVRFIELITCKEGINISPRNISLSTCGLVEKIYRLMDEAPHITLSISLHAPNDEIRCGLMPVAKRYKMDSLLNAARDYANNTGRRIIFEYALIKGVNNGIVHAEELSRRLRRISCHVNLIPLNFVKERGLMGVSRESANEFAGMLASRHISATVRREMGADIEGTCGQLRRRVLDEINRESE